MKRVILSALAAVTLSLGLAALAPAIVAGAANWTAGQSFQDSCVAPNVFANVSIAPHVIKADCGSSTSIKEKCLLPNAFSNVHNGGHKITADCVTIPAGSDCIDPIATSSDPNFSVNTDPPPALQYSWVNNDAWSGTHGPQTINVCSEQSWSATLTEPNNGGQIETYPDTEHDAGGRSTMFTGVNNTTPISGFTSISSTFGEDNPKPGDDGWDAGYDLWTIPTGTTGGFVNESMVWNDWQGTNGFWATAAPNTAVTIGGVAYHFHAQQGGSPSTSCNASNEATCEYIFTADTQTSSGTIDALGFWNWEVANGYANASDIPTELEYGTEVAYTGATAPETFNTTAFTVTASPSL